MSNMNLVLELKGYDGNDTNACRSNFRRNAQYIGIETSEEIVQEVVVPASSSVTLFSVSVANAKKLVYLESTLECDITVNSVLESSIKPIAVGDSSLRGVFLKSSDIESLEITNNDATSSLTVYYIAIK